MIVYVAFGGMVATTWVQIIKACLLPRRRLPSWRLLCWLSLAFHQRLCSNLRQKPHPGGLSILSPGKLVSDPVSAVSLGVALVFGTAGLPHILMRFLYR